MEGLAIISNLANAAGLSTIITTIHPKADSPKDCMPNTTSRDTVAVAYTLGVLCRSRRLW